MPGMIHRNVALPAHLFSPEEWRVVELGFSPGLVHRSEAIFALSNGRLAMRGNVDESSPAHEGAPTSMAFARRGPSIIPRKRSASRVPARRSSRFPMRR